MSISDASGIPDHPRTLAEKVWDDHLVVKGENGEPDLIYIDLHLVHEVTSPQAFDGLRAEGRPVRRLDLTIATEDHNTPTLDIDKPIADLTSRTQIETLRRNAAEFGVRLHSLGDKEQGIVHVVGPAARPHDAGHHGRLRRQPHQHPRRVRRDGVRHRHERGRARPGDPDAAAQALQDDGDHRRGRAQARRHREGHHPRRHREDRHRTAARATCSSSAAARSASLSMEGRMTICNMSIEAGARAGMVAPDETTFAYLEGRPHAPKGQDWEDAVAYWRTLPSDEGAVYDAEVFLDANELEPFVTWGTNPGQGVSLSDVVPSPDDFADPNERAAAERALEYMDLQAGTPLKDVAVDAVFMGSCTNSRIEDLRAFASIVKGRKKADGVRVMVVPGSARVRLEAEAEGLDKVFVDFGAEWRFAGCSMCLGMNPDQLAPGERCASTSNRNFEGRQGKGGRTHLVSPLVAAATAVRGTLSSPERSRYAGSGEGRGLTWTSSPPTPASPRR